ncbi:unnamed protein product [Agarophyton chilense]|eukprot:gb/GEZJ01007371.1/.p1 GENE.gb/GEZJ01007371.1/~~gb/GEZJ01007371.1/.p1  ORF type:complete len:350 (-),score=18.85 gb/GEZJ01007371.1/:447-1496(-)
MSNYKHSERFIVFNSLLFALVYSVIFNLSAASVIPDLFHWLENGEQAAQLVVNATTNHLIRFSGSEELILGPPSEDSDLEICGHSKNGTTPCSRVVCEEWLTLSKVTNVGGSRCICECCNGQKATCEVTFNPAGTFLGCGCVGSITGDKEVSSTTVDEDTLETVNLTNSENETEEAGTVPDCVETAWLKQHGFSHGILHERCSSSVLCIPGLPCATAGHLLRECDAVTISCNLRTYEHICEQRDDCMYRCAEVSRLSNSVDWSVVRSAGPNGSSISLTSLSVHPYGGRLSVSYGVAYVADLLNTHGFGHICDFVVLSMLGIGEMGVGIREMLGQLREEYLTWCSALLTI